MTTLLRQVPGHSVVHRLWAGTKLLAVAAVGLTLSLGPSWAAIGVVAVLVLATAAVARVPLGAVPRFPFLLWGLVALGLLLGLLGGGSPELTVGGVYLGFGGLLLNLRALVLTGVLVLSALLVGWTTPLGDVAPALARLGAPLRRVRLPVDEWAVTTALCLRGLPLLAEELRVLNAVRRLRRPPGRRTAEAVNDELTDLVATAMAVAMRRAGELGEAITARGGAGRVAADRGGPRVRDAVALVVVAAVCAGVWWLR